MFGLYSSKNFPFFLIIFCVLGITFSIAEEHIIWIGSLKDQSDLKNETTLKDRVFDFIFGKSELTLNRPVSLTCEDGNILWILDQDIYRPLLINQKSADFELVQSEEKQTYPSMVCICSGNDGKLYYTDSFLNKIFMLNPDDNKIEEFAPDNNLNRPTGIAYSLTTGNIYVAETGMHRIIIINPNGQIVKTIGKRGTGEGEFNFPNYIWIDKNGRLYIVDSLNFRIQIFSTEGKFITMFGQAGSSSGYMARPKGIATDSNGNIYIVDALFHVVQIFNSQGDFLYSFGKKGKGQSEFWLPSGIFIDDEDKIYVADTYNSRIQIFQYNSGIMDDN